MLRFSKRCALYSFPSKANRYKPRFFTARSVGLLLALVVLLELGLLAESTLLTKSERYLTSVLPGALASFSNDARTAESLPALLPDALLSEAAQLKAEDMARRGYFSHQTPEGQEPWIFLERVGYNYSRAGENLAVNFSDSKAVTDAWLLSPSHRANLLNKDFSTVGFGIATGTYQGRDAVFVVQFLAAPSLREAALPEKPSAPAVSASSSSLMSEGSGEVRAYATESSSLWGRIISSPRMLSSILTLGLLFMVAVLFVVSVTIKLRVQHREVWSNGLLALGAIAGLVLLQGSLFPDSASLPETAANVHRSMQR